MSFSSSYHATVLLALFLFQFFFTGFWQNVRFVHLFIAGATEEVMVGLIMPGHANIVKHRDSGVCGVTSQVWPS